MQVKWTSCEEQYSIFRRRCTLLRMLANSGQKSTPGKAGQVFRMAFAVMALPSLVTCFMTSLLQIMDLAVWDLMFYMRRKLRGMLARDWS